MLLARRFSRPGTIRQRIPLFSRYVMSMATPRVPPSEPLMVVMGTTGVGKSDLAVELACRFNGEIINADAMQMYRGLPIITNKISAEEQRGVPHHLLGIIGLDEPTWDVHVFRREADKTIREIRSRGRVPIVVGGTHYYTDGLLFDDHLVTTEDGDDDSATSTNFQSRAGDHPILAAPTEDILAKLREVDPVMADRWQPKDRRKIQRSLEIFLTTGRRASDIYAEQQVRKEAKRRQLSTAAAAPIQRPPWQTLMFWVYSDRDVLTQRLDGRVDKMIERGLIEETSELFEHLQTATANGAAIDRTTGIWQSIGFSEIEPYLTGLAARQGHDQDQEQDHTPITFNEASLQALKLSGIEAIKAATRRYARHQVRWIKRKTLPWLRDEGDAALGHMFVVDSTDISRWQQDVAGKAVAVTKRFLDGQGPPFPPSSSPAAAAAAVEGPKKEEEDDEEEEKSLLMMGDAAKEFLEGALAASREAKGTPCHKTCQTCGTTALTEERWEAHLKGNRHRRVTKRAKRTALVPAAGCARQTALAPVECHGDDDQGAAAPGDGHSPRKELNAALSA